MKLTELSESEYLALINSEFEGASSSTRIRRLKEKFGFRIKNRKGKLNALAIAPIQWRRLFEEIEQAETGFDRDAHDRARQIARREALRDIGDIPAVADPELRARCDSSLETFCRTIFPKIFHIEWSPDHFDLCNRLESAILRGGKRAVAYQRGFGKTQFCIAAICWGVLTGRLPMVLLISKNESEAEQIAAGIRRRFATNPQLIALYPEICWIMSVLAKSPTKRHSYKGAPIELKTGEQTILPIVAGAPGSEAVIKCVGIESGSIRGSHYDRSDGTTVRPKLVLLDDPQDDQSAKNPETVRKLVNVVKSAVHGVVGPNERLAVFMPCTCIAPNCLASQFTDRAKEPEYQGVRQAALDSFPMCIFPDNPRGLPNHWEKYDQIRRDDLASGDDDHQRATLYFLANKTDMIDGASVRWEGRIEPPAVHAVQYLMNLYLIDRASFMSEYQQDPLDSSANVAYLNEDQIAGLNNGMNRGYCPASAELITTAIDVQESVLYWMVTAWAPGFTGFILNWGTWPEQPPGRFDHHSIQRTISAEVRRLFPGVPMTWKEEMKIAVQQCAEMLLLPVDAENESRPVDCVVIDARWEKITAIVQEVATEDRFRGRVIPAGGQFVGPNRPSLSRSNLSKTQQRVDRETEWILDSREKGVYFVEFDANHYRTLIQTGLAKAAGSKNATGRITFNGQRPSKFLASHLAAKRVQIMEGQRRTIEHWKNKPGADQDHWLDCLVMARVGAEHEGMRASGQRANRPKTRTANRRVITQADIPKG